MPFYSSELQSWTPPTLAAMRGTPRWNVIKTDFTLSRLSQRVSYQEEFQESWTLSCSGLTAAEWRAIKTLYLGCKGSLIPFKLTIDGEVKYCRILAFDWEKRTPISYDVTLTVEEVASAEILMDE